MHKVIKSVVCERSGDGDSDSDRAGEELITCLDTWSQVLVNIPQQLLTTKANLGKLHISGTSQFVRCDIIDQRFVIWVNIRNDTHTYFIDETFDIHKWENSDTGTVVMGGDGVCDEKKSVFSCEESSSEIIVKLPTTLSGGWLLPKQEWMVMITPWREKAKFNSPRENTTKYLSFKVTELLTFFYGGCSYGLLKRGAFLAFGLFYRPVRRKSDPSFLLLP